MIDLKYPGLSKSGHGHQWKWAFIPPNYNLTQLTDLFSTTQRDCNSNSTSNSNSKSNNNLINSRTLHLQEQSFTCEEATGCVNCWVNWWIYILPVCVSVTSYFSILFVFIALAIQSDRPIGCFWCDLCVKCNSKRKEKENKCPHHLYCVCLLSQVTRVAT